MTSVAAARVDSLRKPQFDPSPFFDSERATLCPRLRLRIRNFHSNPYQRPPWCQGGSVFPSWGSFLLLRCRQTNQTMCPSIQQMVSATQKRGVPTDDSLLVNLHTECVGVVHSRCSAWKHEQGQNRSQRRHFLGPFQCFHTCINHVAISNDLLFHASAEAVIHHHWPFPNLFDVNLVD